MDDLDFVARCVGRDKSAWEEFLKKYGRLIYSYIHSILRMKGAVYDPSLPEEIFHEIISSLFQNNLKKLRSFKGKNNATLATWLRIVTINFCVDYLSKEAPLTLSLDERTEEGAPLAETVAYRGRSAGEEIEDKEKIQQLVECIQQLGVDDRLFLELNFKRGLGLEELRDFFRISRGAIDMRRKRIIDRLKECFRKKGFEAV